MTPLIDIHTYNPKGGETIEVAVVKSANESYRFLYGIHPWDVQDGFNEKVFKEVIKHKNFMGLGEIGLDKLKDSFEDQVELFNKQVKFAVDNNIKLLLIHNIKSSAEIIHALKKYDYSGCIIIHDFNISKESFDQFNKIAKTYVATGHMYLKNEKTRELFSSIPIDRVFFETADKDILIKEVYESFSEHSNTPLKALKKTIYSNFTNLQKSINIEH